jgi:hypothetical protein
MDITPKANRGCNIKDSPGAAAAYIQVW